MNKEINTIIANLEGCIGMFDYLLTPTESNLLVSYIEELQQENKILKENAENNDKVVDKINWENQLLKKKYENAVSDYETTMSELQELRKQLEEYKRLGFKHLNDKCNKLENQQKEFIEYMNKTIEELECDDFGDEEMKGYLIQRIDTFKEILSKFKKIIGSDINVGSKGDKE